MQQLLRVKGRQVAAQILNNLSASVLGRPSRGERRKGLRQEGAGSSDAEMKTKSSGSGSTLYSNNVGKKFRSFSH